MKKKNMANVNVELLKECSLKLEASSSLLNHTENAIYEVTIMDDGYSDELLIKKIFEITNSFNEAKEARAISNLLGEMGLSLLLLEYMNNITAKSDHYNQKLREYVITNFRFKDARRRNYKRKHFAKI